jgi:hypothetical protein
MEGTEMKYHFEVLNAQHLYKSMAHQLLPFSVQFACAKYGFTATQIPLAGHSLQLSIEGEPYDVLKKVKKLNYEFGLRLMAIGTSGLMGPAIEHQAALHRDALRELLEEYGMPGADLPLIEDSVPKAEPEGSIARMNQNLDKTQELCGQVRDAAKTWQPGVP